MSDNKFKPNKTLSKKFAKPKIPSTVSGASLSRDSRAVCGAVPCTVMAENVGARPKVNQNATIIGEADMTEEGCMPDFDAVHREIAYGDFLRAMLEECLVDEKIERQKTEMDIQMTHLAQRFQNTKRMLEKTNRRLKDVSYVVEQKRLQDLKENDCAKFYEMTDKSNAKDLLHSLKVKEQQCLDKLDTKNIDFGDDKTSGHRQLLDAVNEAIDGLEDIKKQSKLNIDKFKEYEKSQISLESLEKDRLAFESLKADFEAKFPKFSEKLMMEASEKLMMEASEKLMMEASEKLMMEASEKLMMEASEKLMMEASEKLMMEASEKLMMEASEKLMMEASEKLMMEASEKLMMEASEKLMMEASEKLMMEASEKLMMEASEKLMMEASEKLMMEASEKLMMEASEKLMMEASEKLMMEASEKFEKVFNDDD